MSDEKLDELVDAINGQRTGPRMPTIRGKTNGFKSSEFWVTLGTTVIEVVDQFAGSGLSAGTTPLGLAYVIGRTFLKSVLVGAQAYQNSKTGN